jgi:hypothetical protein
LTLVNHLAWHAFSGQVPFIPQRIHKGFPGLGIVSHDIEPVEKLLIVKFVVIFDRVAQMEDDRFRHFGGLICSWWLCGMVCVF